MAKADLLKELETLKVTPIKDATDEVLELQIKAAKYDELENSINSTIEEQKTEIETLTASNQSLTESLEAAEKQNLEVKRKSNFPIFKKGKVIYQFKVLSFVFKGDKYKSEDAVENNELMNSLIEINFAHLVKL